MQSHTIPNQPLTLHIQTIAGSEHVLYIGSSNTVRDLHHAVRKLIQLRREAFDLIHFERGGIFGYEREYGSVSFAIVQKRTLCDLQLKDGDVIHVVVLTPQKDSHGETLPAWKSQLKKS